MSKPDTNQASEDDKAIMIGFLYGIQSDFLPADEVRHRMAGFRHTQGYKDAIELIRTEKLKLLAEVRGRVALEARIDELEHTFVSYDNALASELVENPEWEYGQAVERIAELKQELEKL